MSLAVRAVPIPDGGLAGTKFHGVDYAGPARRVLEAWRASGLPLATFARRRGLSPERVRWWRQRLGDWAAPAAESPRLVPAVVMGAAPPTATASLVTLRTPGEFVVEIADVGAVPANWLSALVLGLARPAP